MVTLPYDFTATKFPGYFWNVRLGTLYSLKSGVLTELKRIHPNYWNKNFDGYRVSVKGVRRNLHMEYLKSLNLGWAEIPVK